MTLALVFREPDVDRLLFGISRSQYREWMAYYFVEPFGDQRADRRAATIAQAFAGGSVTDYMPFFDAEESDDVLAEVFASGLE